MSGYIGAGGKARKIKNCYIGVGGKARKIKKMYIGIGGKARLFYDSVKLPESISGQYVGKGYNQGAQVAEFTVTEPCGCMLKLTEISINIGSSARVSALNILGSDGKTVYNLGDSSVSDHPTSLSGSTTLQAGSYTVTALCFGVSGSQSGVSYNSGSMKYSIEFFET